MEQTSKISFYNKNYFLNILFFIFIALILITRIRLFLDVNLQWIDSDQPFMWIGARDYAKGLFYEPRFYGQNYNTFMEPFFSVPLIWVNIPVYFALPIATHFIFLFPFLFTASYLFQKQKKENALTVLAIVLCMPVAYDILNCIPRGFVTGLFFTSFFVLSFFNPHSIRFVVINTLMATIGYFVNPNSTIVSVPLFVYLFLHNYRNTEFYLAGGICLLFVYPLHLFFNQFYISHPTYVIYGLNYNISWAAFTDNISHLDQAFEHVSFFIEGSSIILIAVLILLPFTLFKQDRKLFYAYLGFVFIILFSFFSGKVREGAAWPFYSYSRMYLGIPIVISLLTSNIHLSRKCLSIILIPAVLFFSGYKLFNFKKSIAYHLDESRWLGVHLAPLPTVLDAILVYKNFCKNNGTDRMIISNGFWLATYLDYGGPAVLDDFPKTEETNSERRFYVREENKNKTFEKFVLISSKPDLDKLLPEPNGFEIKRLDDYGVFLIENNRMRNDVFMALIREKEKN
jgi:hypothetical protein